MSDLLSYHTCFEQAEQYEAEGDLLQAAIEYWTCTQIAKHGEFVVVPDLSIERRAIDRYQTLSKEFPYAPLSKTTFIKGCQCEKALWLYRNRYDLREISEETKKKFARGHRIGEIAMLLFPGGEDASGNFKLDYQLKSLQQRTPLRVHGLPYKLKQNLWVRQTREAIEDHVPAIYEAAFTHNDVFAAVDILCPDGDGHVAYEVKSSFDVKDVYIHDCALQYYVISHNLKLNDIILVYLDEEYVKSLGVPIDELTPENCDPQRLFIRRSVLAEVTAMQQTIMKEISQMKKVLKATAEPKIARGSQCTSPYECEFIQYCSNKYTEWFPYG